MNDNEDIYSGTHWLRQESMYHIKDGLDYVKPICVTTITKYEEYKLTDKSIVESKLNVLHVIIWDTEKREIWKRV